MIDIFEKLSDAIENSHSTIGISYYALLAATTGTSTSIEDVYRADRIADEDYERYDTIDFTEFDHSLLQRLQRIAEAIRHVAALPDKATTVTESEVSNYVIEFQRGSAETEWLTWAFCDFKNDEQARSGWQQQLPRLESIGSLRFQLVSRRARITDTVLATYYDDDHYDC